MVVLEFLPVYLYHTVDWVLDRLDKTVVGVEALLELGGGVAHFICPLCKLLQAIYDRLR